VTARLKICVIQKRQWYWPTSRFGGAQFSGYLAKTLVAGLNLDYRRVTLVQSSSSVVVQKSKKQQPKVALSELC
jgi:hypothetical protein